MFNKFFILILFFSIVPVGHLWAQQDPVEQSIEKASEGSVVNTVSIERAQLYLEACLSDFPNKFTPKSHQNFCHCSAANMRLNMSNFDLDDLNKRNTLKAGNPVFEKYVEKVIAPCMAIAVRDIAYVSCLEERDHDPYIRNILSYCRCTGHEMAKFTQQKGASTVIINMTNNPQFYKDPRHTLLASNEYAISLYNAYKTCRPIGMEKKGN